MIEIKFTCRSCGMDDYTAIRPGSLIYCNDCGTVFMGTVVLEKIEVEDEVILEEVEETEEEMESEAEEDMEEFEDEDDR